MDVFISVLINLRKLCAMFAPYTSSPNTHQNVQACSDACLKKTLLHRIRENFRMSNFRIIAKWSISNGFIFEFPAHPPHEKLRCPDALKYVLCRVNG